MPWLCTTIAGSMPILVASCRAAASARGPGGTGRVNDIWTMPSPVVSPYGRTIPRSDTGHLPRALEQLQRRVEGAVGEPDDAVQALALVRRALGDAEGAVGDRGQDAAGVVGDAAEQVDGPAEHVAGHVLGRRHPLQRRVREQRAGEHRVRELQPERLLPVGVDLEGVAEPELPVLEP